MTNLVPRENLFTNLFEFRRDFDQLFNHILAGNPLAPEFNPAKKAVFLPAVEAYIDKDGKTYICRVSLPGIEAKDVEIQLVEHLLTIKGEKQREEEVKEDDYYQCERSFGSFTRDVALPCEVKADQVKASFKNGVLEVRMPKAEAAKKKTIPVEIK